VALKIHLDKAVVGDLAIEDLAGESGFDVALKMRLIYYSGAFGATSNSRRERKKQTSNSMKKLVCPSTTGTS
jgi:hypothetical protein